MNGSAFSSYAVIPYNALEVFGSSDLGAYFVTSRATKHYCSRCGTPLFNLNSKYAGACMLYLGAIERGEDYSPAINAHCESMLSWLASVTSLEGYQGSVERDA
jgi:hypothetical protein